MESNTSSSSISSSSVRPQVLMAIQKQFYMHKSFDIQSDMEFLPDIPQSQFGFSTGFVPDDSFGSSTTIRGEYFSNRPSSSQLKHLNNMQSTPKFNRPQHSSSPRSIPIMPNMHSSYKASQNTAANGYLGSNTSGASQQNYNSFAYSRPSRK